MTAKYYTSYSTEILLSQELLWLYQYLGRLTPHMMTEVIMFLWTGGGFWGALCFMDTVNCPCFLLLTRKKSFEKNLNALSQQSYVNTLKDLGLEISQARNSAQCYMAAWMGGEFEEECFPGGSGGREYTCKARDVGSIPGLGRFPGGGNGDPLHYPCRRNPLDRGAWWVTVHRVAKSQTLGKTWRIKTSFKTVRNLPL